MKKTKQELHQELLNVLINASDKAMFYTNKEAYKSHSKTPTRKWKARLSEEDLNGISI